MRQTAPARKIVGSHPLICIPLGRLGNTSLPNLRACRDPSQGSITGVQQLTIVTRKYNLQAPRLLTLCAVDNSTQHRVVAE